VNFGKETLLMLSLVPSGLAAALVLSFAPVTCWAQTTSGGGAGRATQYVITLSKGTAGFQPQNPFSGSAPGGNATSNVLPLSLKDAIDRGLKQNLGLLLASEGISSARGQWWNGLGDLLPNLNTSTSVSLDLAVPSNPSPRAD
jgi:hypothetical protein